MKRIAIPNAFLPIFSIFFASIIWGVSWWPLKQFATQGIDSIPLIAVAYGVTGLGMLPFLIFNYSSWKSEKHLLLLIFILGGYANLAFAASLIYGEVVRSMALFYTLPIWGVLGGRIFLNEEIDIQRAFAVLLAIVGAFFILGGMKVFETPPSSADFLAVSSGFAFSMNNLCFRKSPLTPVISKVAAMFIGCGFFAGALCVFGVQNFPTTSVSTWILPIGFGLVVLLATFGTQWGVTQLEVGRASALIVMELITAVISATLIAGETMAPLEWFGGAMILSAALLEAWR